MRKIISILALTLITACAPEVQNPPVAQPQPEVPAPVEPVPTPAPVKPAVLPAPVAGTKFVVPNYSAAEKAAVLANYVTSDKIPAKHLVPAILYYHANLPRIKNKTYLSVIDFSVKSGVRRFYILNMKTGALQTTVVTHGEGSDTNNDGMAEKFSNVSGTHTSSIGFYLTAETYTGKHGLSLRLDGLSATNSNVRARAIVIHGATYAVNGKAQQGRSWGCPAVPMDLKDHIISILKGGSLLYAMN